MAAPSAQILGFGNPLLDITADVDPKFLEKYELDANTQYMANEKTLPLFKELESMPGKKMVPGGSSQNAIRAAQWALNVPGITAFSGCVGEDEFGREQREILKREGVTCLYDTTTAEPTGTCAALITGKNRCLVANIGAANCFQVSHLLHGSLPEYIRAAKVFYCESFFVTVSMHSLLFAAHHALHHAGKYFAMNLSAKWVIESQLVCLLELLPYADLVFCNEDEARCFARQMKWKEEVDVSTIASNIALLPKLDATKRRIVCITQGADPVILAVARFDVDEEKKEVEDKTKISPMGHTGYSGQYSLSDSFVSSHVSLQTFPVQPIPKSEMKDTNGCGDSFVGAFLASFIKDLPLEKCVDNGNKMAQIIARADGCVFPQTHDFTL